MPLQPNSHGSDFRGKASTAAYTFITASGSDGRHRYASSPVPNHEHYAPSTLPRITPENGVFLPSYLRNTPPPHERPLYWTVPLPQVDVSGSSPLQASHSSPHRVLRHPVRLHPLLSHAQLFPKNSPQTQRLPESQSASSSSQRVLPVSQSHLLHNYDVPATMPGVGYLTLVIRTMGQTINVRPMSRSRYAYVSVRDVLEVVEESFWFVQHGCPSHPHGNQNVCRCEATLVVAESLLLQWTHDGAS